MKLFSVLATSALVFMGCQAGSKTGTQPAPGMWNAGCPFTGRPVGEGAPTADWNGQKVGFCCAGCQVRWSDWSDEQKEQFVDAQ